MRIPISYLKRSLIAIFLIIFIFLFQCILEPSNVGNLILSLCCLIVNLHIIYRNKNNMQMFLIAIIIFYFNYSAIINYYIFEQSSVLAFTQCNTIELKETAIIGLLIFTIIIDCFVDWEKIPCYELRSLSNRKNIGFYIILVVLIFVWLICLKRGQLGNGYKVYNISYFEYSYILFVLGLWFANGNKLQEYVLSILLVMYVFEDVYYGGRISSLEFILVFYLMLFYKYFNKKRILIAIMSAILLFSIVSVYRVNYSLVSIDSEALLSFVGESRFSLDSASNAFYSTLCAIGGSNTFSPTFKMENFWYFILDAVIGIEMGDYETLPELLKTNGFYNIGGCWCVGYMYFWFGYMGIIVFSLFITLIVNKLSKMKTGNLQKLLFIIIFVTIPRWYLYTPSAFLRGIVLFGVFYFILKLFIKFKEEYKVL